MKLCSSDNHYSTVLQEANKKIEESTKKLIKNFPDFRGGEVLNSIFGQI